LNVGQVRSDEGGDNLLRPSPPLVLLLLETRETWAWDVNRTFRHIQQVTEKRLIVDGRINTRGLSGDTGMQTNFTMLEK